MPEHSLAFAGHLGEQIEQHYAQPGRICWKTTFPDTISKLYFHWGVRLKYQRMMEETRMHLRAEGDLHSLGKAVNALQQQGSRIVAELNLLARHAAHRSSMDRYATGRRGRPRKRCVRTLPCGVEHPREQVAARLGIPENSAKGQRQVLS